MNKKIIISIVAAVGIVAVLGILSAKPNNEVGDKQANAPVQKPARDTGNMSIAVAPAQKVEVFMFHRAQRCITCITIGKLSGKTVEERFGPETLSGKVLFREVNIDEPQNKELAGKFQASGSALFINAIREGSDNIQEDMNVWRLTGDEESFKNYLADKINNLLGKQ